MGYYDDHYNREGRTKKGSKAGYIFSSLVGVIIGALLVLFVVPQMNGGSNGGETLGLSNTDENSQVETKKVSVDVETEITSAVEKARGAVVSISNIQSAGMWSNGQNGESTQGVEAGSGSGVIYKKEGDHAFIVTNHHVVDGAERLEVNLFNGEKIAAELVGSDVWTDLAVLEIDGSIVEDVAEFGDSDTLSIGEPAIAIGNPLGQFEGSVTKGIISGLNRTVPVDIDQNGTVDWNAEVLQTDAAINPGNSGGALVNISGQVIGINSMKIAESSVEGIGLAIPINFAQTVISDLEQHGEVRRPYMGVQIASVSDIPAYYQEEALKLPKDVENGVVVSGVEPNGPAAEAGLKEMDVIVELDGEEITDVLDLRHHLYGQDVGDEMKVKYYREGKLAETTMALKTENTF